MNLKTVEKIKVTFYNSQLYSLYLPGFVMMVRLYSSRTLTAELDDWLGKSLV